jgi:hypothetical protein
VAGRRRFSEEDKRRIVDEASQPGASVSRTARRYGIAARVLFRWKEALRPKPKEPTFAPVQITDAVPLDEPPATHVALGVTDMRKGLDGLTMLVQGTLKYDPFSGHLFVFRGRKADLLKILFWDGTGLCLFTKRLELGNGRSRCDVP